MQDKLYIFPTHRALKHFYLNKTNQFLPKLLTIDEFYQNILFVRDKEYICNDRKILILKDIVKKIDLEKQRKNFYPELLKKHNIKEKNRAK